MASSGKLSLRQRLLIWLAAPVILLLIMDGFATYFVAVYYAGEVYDDWLYSDLMSIAQLVQRSDRGVSFNLPRTAQMVFEWDTYDLIYFSVSGNRSGLIAGDPDLPMLPQKSSRYRDAAMFDTEFRGNDVRVVSIFLPAAEFGEEVHVQVAETKRKRTKLVRTVFLPTILPQLMLLLIAGLIIWNAFNQGLEPLKSIARALDEKSHHKLSVIPDASVPDEILPLTRALNHLLVRLDNALLAQRRFVSDAAHQLRTPLTGLKLNLDRALREEKLENVHVILNQAQRSADRMTRLSNQLLALARAEPGADGAQAFERLDLRQLVRDSGAEWVPRALEQGIEIVLNSPDHEVEINGSAFLLSEVLDNLIDNTLKYHKGTGALNLTVSGGDKPAVSVEDDGPGIPVHLRESVFNRFQRVDNSEGSGAGLGLSIVKEIISLHGGEVTIHDGLGGRGLRILMTFPRPGL